MLGRTIKVKVRAYDGDDGGEIMDARSYTFCPTSSTGNNSIKFVSPLPGGIVNSKYGPRMHPIHKTMKAHTGIDMKMPDKSVVDVVAAADGEVIYAGGNASTGYGLRVHIKHSTSSGSVICTTTYNHLATYYVSVGDKVMAGQKIGKEGSTGSSTGNHLHFECKLPNGQFVDPEPYIFGNLSVAKKTDPNGDAQDVQPRTSDAVLSSEESKARQVDSCESFGGTYPDDVVGEDYKSPNRGPEPPEPPSTSDIFPYCFTTSMKQEVGPFWNESNAAVISGSTATADDRKQVGFVDDPIDRGGLTKYGIAQNANRTTDVKTIDLAGAKDIYYNKYFKASKADTLPDQLAVMHFDTAVNHGVSQANRILAAAGGSSATVDQYAAARLKVYEEIVRKNPSQARFTRGWSNRVTAVTTAAKAA
jgi:murein DD-endopeptidase MepM/ murein hydrolase activator NlpD